MEEDNQEWVQCDRCKKWRTLPPRVSAADLPEIWYCELNTWDPSLASCDVDEVKIESNVREYPMSSGMVAQINTSIDTNKLSYRNLIFGTGRKLYRPTSERARAADSLFTCYDSDDELCAHPKFMYAESSAFCAKPSRNHECFKHQGFLDHMNNSMLWDELYGVNNAPLPIQKDDFDGKNLLNVKFRRKDGNDMKSDAFYKDLIMSVLSTKTLAFHEILFELDFVKDATFEEILRDLNKLNKDDCIEIVDNLKTDEQHQDAMEAVSTAPRLTKYKKPWKFKNGGCSPVVIADTNSTNDDCVINNCALNRSP